MEKIIKDAFAEALKIPQGPIVVTVKNSVLNDLIPNNSDYKVKQDSVKIGLLKIDDRGKTPLDDVGFKFRAKVQRYEKVGEETHYKKCEHDENKDGFGRAQKDAALLQQVRQVRLCRPAEA